jgi:replicative DNA helicase
VAAADDILRRVPPQNLDAEQSVLGAILLDNEAINVALEVLSADDFYRDAHRRIYQAMADLSDRSQPVDAITLTDALRSRGVLEQTGGPAYIAELAAIVPTAANVGHYARIVREKSVLRNLASVATDIASSAFEAPPNVDEFLDTAEHRIFEISERRVRASFVGMPELTRESIGLLERMYERREIVTGVPTGFVDFDRLTAGLQPGELVIIAARPSVGKTALAMNIAAYAALEADPPVGVAFFSLEMSKEQLGLRFLCAEARVNSARARQGFFNNEEMTRFVEAAGRLHDAKIFVDDSSDTSPIVLKAKCRRLKRERSSNLGLIVVDYLQLMRSSMRQSESREKEIAEISRSLKALAKELKVPVIALSQLNRQVEGRPNRRPLLADLRESGAIEQDADVIAFIYRDDMYNKTDSKEPGVAEIIIAKQRNGPTDTIRLAYLAEYTRFESYTADAAVFEESGR